MEQMPKNSQEGINNVDLDFTNQKNLSPIDAQILDTTNIIARVEDDLQTETDQKKVEVLMSVMQREQEKRKQLLDKKFAAATPTTPQTEDLYDFPHEPKQRVVPQTEGLQQNP